MVSQAQTMIVNLYQQNLVSIDSLTVYKCQLIFARAREMEKLVHEKGGDDRLKGKIAALLFFEPSTRTFSSFATAMQRLGGGMIPLNGMQNTSIEKGESFEHTVRVFSNYADILIVRHPEIGLPQQAATIAKVPVINAGDGIGEHPTQALYDVFTIFNQFGQNKKITVTMIGDLKNGRTVHSLSKLLSKFELVEKINLVSPEMLKMPPDILSFIKKGAVDFEETEDIKGVIETTDVLYVTRVQKERFTDLGQYEKYKSFYRVNRKLLETAKQSLIVMHPLPIAAGEIAAEMDDDSRSLYLNKQLTNGLYIRMAILDLILRKSS